MKTNLNWKNQIKANLNTYSTRQLLLVSLVVASKLEDSKRFKLLEAIIEPNDTQLIEKYAQTVSTLFNRESIDSIINSVHNVILHNGETRDTLEFKLLKNLENQ